MFQYTYLFGAFSPVTGDKFFLEMPYCSGDTFQLYLNQFSELNPKEYKIMVLDNGAFHKCKRLKIPENVALLFLPPYSPELNPAEKIWKHIKRKFTNRHFSSLGEISEFFTHCTNAIDKSMVKSTCAFSYILLSPFWSV